MTFRRRVCDVGDVYVTADPLDDGTWSVCVTDAASRPVGDDVRERALHSVLGELSSLRAHIWHIELKQPKKAS